MRAVYERGDTGRHSEARERALEHECTALGIPHVSPRATLAQAFRRNVPGIASLRPFGPSFLRSRLPSVPLRCVRVVRMNSGFRTRPEHFS